MFTEIKRSLLEAPDSIINILTEYDFYKPQLRYNEIRCGLYEGSNPTAICIRLKDNDKLYVTDFSRNVNADIINYIIKVKNVTFKEVLGSIKAELGIENFYSINTKRSAFGGFYDTIYKQNSELYVKTYPDSILNEYKNVYSRRFAQDNISFAAQDYFGIGYDAISQRITIPIYNLYGELIGIKGRATWEVADDEPKYLYLVPCPMSSTLYGYSHNYQYLQGDTIYVFEAEKSPQQCYTFGVRNAVALGSNSLSDIQCKLLMSVQPKRIVWMLDKGLDLQNTFTNIDKLRKYTRMSDVQILYWDWCKSDLPDKSSPSDYGKAEFEKIVREQLYEARMDSNK